jgi:hypothetical protein
MPCSCGFTSNQDNTCNGNHKIVKSVKDSILKNLDEMFLLFSDDTFLEFKSVVIKTVKESK